MRRGRATAKAPRTPRLAKEIGVGRREEYEGTGDLLVDDSLVVELKACECLAPIHVAQTLSYLRATGIRLALLINFNVRLFHRGIKRIIGPP